MNQRIKNTINSHEDFSRLKKAFPLDFVVECLTNPRRGNPGNAKFIGYLLKTHAKDSSLFISAIHYHELVELEKFRTLGYSNVQLGENHGSDPSLKIADTEAKEKELNFYNFIALKINGKRYPNLSWPLSNLSVIGEYNMSIPPFEAFCRMLNDRRNDFYQEKFSQKDVEDCISLLKLGGDQCRDKEVALNYAKRYLNGEKVHRVIQPWEMV